MLCCRGITPFLYATAAFGNSIHVRKYDSTKQFFAVDFYRAMHFSAKRGIGIACRLSVRLSVCDVGEL